MANSGAPSKDWADDEAWADDEPDPAPASRPNAWGNLPQRNNSAVDTGASDRDFPSLGSASHSRKSPAKQDPRDRDHFDSVERERDNERDRRNDGDRPRNYDDRERGRYEDRERGGRPDDRDRRYDDRERRPYDRDRRYEDRGSYGDRRRGNRYEDRRGGEGDYGERERPRQQEPFPTSPPWTAFLGNLSYEVTERDLEDYLIDHGCKIESIRLIIDRDTRRMKGYGYVDFADADSLKKALECDDVEFFRRPLRVDIPKQRESPSHRREDDDSGSGRPAWRSHRERERERPHRTVADPLHEGDHPKAEGSSEPDKAGSPEAASSMREEPPARPSKARSNPFGDAKPIDNLEAQKRIAELQKQLEDEKKKKDDEERTKKEQEEEERKKKEQEEEERLKKQKEEDDKAKKPATSWRTEKAETAATKPQAASAWASNRKPGVSDSGAAARSDSGKSSHPKGRDHPKDYHDRRGGDRDNRPKRQESGGGAGGGRGRGRGVSRVGDSREQGRYNTNSTRSGHDSRPGGSRQSDRPANKSASPTDDKNDHATPKKPAPSKASPSSSPAKPAPSHRAESQQAAQTVDRSPAPVKEDNAYALLGDEQI